MKKLRKIAQNMDLFAKTAYGICSAFVWVCGIFAVLLLVFGEKMVSEGTAGLDLGAYSFEFAQGYMPFAVVKSRMVLGLIFAALLLVFVCYVIRVVRQILQPMAAGKPFDSAVSGSLRKLSWITLIGGGILSAVQLAGELVIYHMYDLETLFLSEKIAGVTTNCNLDMTFLLGFALLYLLSCVFRYGEALQQESDETL